MKSSNQSDEKGVTVTDQVKVINIDSDVEIASSKTYEVVQEKLEAEADIKDAVVIKASTRH